MTYVFIFMDGTRLRASLDDNEYAALGNALSDTKNDAVMITFDGCGRDIIVVKRNLVCVVPAKTLPLPRTT